jgi:ATP adenylyltransferase/5',5'''-P-1,P-4-tetraphosphate phosphorylase II
MIINDRPERNSSADWWAEQSKKLLEDQKQSWQLLNENYQNLSAAKIRTFEFDGFEIKVQYNPARIKSSSADVSEDAIKSRKCFLCLENLPKEQTALGYNKNFVILANPYPIFPEHFTISKKNHTPQTLIGNFAEMLVLSRDLGKYYSVFYNGPKCGSSAPDHMHFQAITINAMPIEIEFDKMINKFSKEVLRNGKIEVRFFEEHLRYFISCESRDKGELLYVFKTLVNALRKISPPHEEPLINMLVNYQENIWRLIFYPRSKHRPKQFFADGDNQLLISPAVVDMSGLFIVPREEDFLKITRDDAIDIYKQVTITKEYFEYLRKKIGDVFI